MSFKPDPRQALCILGMLFGQTDAEREPMMSKLKPELNPKQRKVLVDAGLLETQRRGRSTHLVPTDAAWQWASAHLDTELMDSKLATPILHNVLVQLGRFLASRELALADLILVSAEPAVDEAVAREESEPRNIVIGAPENGGASYDLAPHELCDRVRRVIWDIAGGTAKKRVRLSELRNRLGELPRSRLDALLLEMQAEGRVVLYRLDNPVELTSADHHAALLIGENPRHLVYLES